MRVAKKVAIHAAVLCAGKSLKLVVMLMEAPTMCVRGRQQPDGFLAQDN
jgi:hypothetical protein